MLISLLISFAATFFVGIMLDMDIKISLYSAVAGCISYAIFLLIKDSKIAYFAATFILSLASFIFAKAAKSPSTVFIVIGIYTLVPGSGVYQTMQSIINSNYDKAMELGANTFINLTLMAMAIAVSNSLSSAVFGFFERKPPKK